MTGRVKTGSTQHDLVECDLEYPRLQKQLRELGFYELEAFLKKVATLNKMTWNQVHATFSKGSGKRGLNWEVLAGQKTANGGTVASIRITDKFRARVAREGVFMRFISLHPDHDSAYKARGGEDV